MRTSSDVKIRQQNLVNERTNERYLRLAAGDATLAFGPGMKSGWHDGFISSRRSIFILDAYVGRSIPLLKYDAEI